MSVYSFRIAYVEGAGKTVTYTVPEKKRVVVKSVCAFNAGTVDVGVYVRVHGIPAYMSVVPVSTRNISTSMMMVAYERETIELTTTGTATGAMLCGYIFDDPGGAPATGKPIEPGRPALPE